MLSSCRPVSYGLTNGRTRARYTKPTVHTAACDEWMVGQTDRQTDGHLSVTLNLNLLCIQRRVTGRWWDRQTDRQTDGHLSVTLNLLSIQRRMTGRWWDRQTDGRTDT